MDRDTQIGGELDRFPLTRRSVVEAVRDPDPKVRDRAMELLLSVYWKPVYKHIRMKWRASNEEAKDLTQGFFASVLEKGFVARYERGLASFRTYLRLGVDGYVANERKSAQRIKRGGDQRFVSLDFDAADGELRRIDPLARTEEEPFFDREFLRSLFERAVAELRKNSAADGKIQHFALFERYDLHGAVLGGRLTYEQLAKEFDLPVTQVTNHLAWARREFRRCALEILRELTADENEFRDESLKLFGSVP